jgi:hypothetical protein
MIKVVIDQATLAKLHDLREHIEVCDEAGITLGYFQPAPSRDRSLYEGVEPPISEEELQLRERELGGRTLAEILDDLEKMA